MAQERPRGGLFEQDWIRCSEGFSEINNKVGSTPAAPKTANAEQEQVASTLGSGPKNSKYRTGTSGIVTETRKAAPADETSQSITWSSSGSESDSDKRVEARKRRRKSAGDLAKSKRRSATLKIHTDVEIIDLAESDSETAVCNQGSSRSCAGSLKTQSTDGGIQGFESDPEVQIIRVHGDVQADTQKSASQDSVVISEPASSASPVTTQTGNRVKASDWAKSLCLKTPTKSGNQDVGREVEDSAKKKKKHTRGGMADQLARLLARERSARRMWTHQQNKGDAASQDADKLIQMKVVGFECLYSTRLAQCERTGMVDEQASTLVMFPASQATELNLQIGTEFTIYPPWQQFQLRDGRHILLCTHNCRVASQVDATDVFHGDPTESKLSEDFKVSVSLRWNCPCAQGLCKNTTLCPAYRYPCVPGIIQEAKPHEDKQKDNSSNPDPVASHLQTISSDQKSGIPQCDSLLASIGNSGNLDDSRSLVGFVGRGSVCFKGLVHRVTQRMNARDNWYHVIIEDGCGTLSELQLTESDAAVVNTNITKCEGKSFTFYGLRVKTRIIREGDPHLFSLIDHVWSGTANTATSQDSEDATMATSKPSPPAFCYILESDPACNLDVQPSPADVAPFRPVDYVRISQVDETCPRCSCVGRVVYCETLTIPFFRKSNQFKFANYCQTVEILKESQFSHLLYMTDKTLQKHSDYCTVQIAASCNYRHNMKDKCLFLKDAYIEKGEMQADVYSVISTSSQGQSKSTDDLLHIVPRLPLFDAAAEKLSLCSIQGVISEVDEESAYSWDACNFCAGDQLVAEPGNQGSLRCALCRNVVTNPGTKMKMEVLLKCPHLSDTVRVDLLQSTIEGMLPTDDSVEEGYDLACVLNRYVGPISCLVLKPGRTGLKDARLKEIQLLI